MSVDPVKIIGEVLGQPAGQMRNPVNADYMCPFTPTQCMKRSQKIAGPYPLCSVFHGVKQPRLITTCPKRFFEADLKKDVIEHAWKGEAPKNPCIAYEVQLKKFGMVDFVVADYDEESNTVKNFISVELQAVDLTGSVEPAYQALINSEMLEKRPSYGVNWANVQKRYIHQVINKGFYHHHWGARIVSIIQLPLYEYFQEQLNFDEISLDSASCNIVFMLYDYSNGEGSKKKLQFKKVIGTSHNSLMMRALYREPPDREVFVSKIKERLM